MADLSRILSSQARFRILHSLCRLDRAVPLRHLEALTGLAIRSVQVAVEGLEREHLLLKRVDQRHTQISLDPRHPSLPLLRSIFELVDQEQRQKQAADGSEKAQSVLRFSEEMRTLLRKAKPL